MTWPPIQKTQTLTFVLSVQRFFFWRLSGYGARIIDCFYRKCSLTQDTSTLSLLATTPLATSSFSLPGTSLSMASSNAQLPASIGTSRPILVSPLVNMFASPTVCPQACSHQTVRQLFPFGNRPHPPCRPCSSCSLLQRSDSCWFHTKKFRRWLNKASTYQCPKTHCLISEGNWSIWWVVSCSGHIISYWCLGLWGNQP